MKLTITMLYIALLTACGDGRAVSVNGSSSKDTTIIGTWSFTYPAVQCTETYVFKFDKRWSATSLDAQFGGNYEFSNQSNTSDREKLSLTWTSDNQQSDCEGDMDSKVGQITDLYVTFVSSTIMEWYSQPSGGSVEVTLNKQ